MVELRAFRAARVWLHRKKFGDSRTSFPRSEERANCSTRWNPTSDKGYRHFAEDVSRLEAIIWPEPHHRGGTSVLAG